MDVTRYLARWFFRTALRFKWAYIAVEFAGTIQKCLALVHGTARPEPLSSRAMVDVTGRVKLKVAAREGAVILCDERIDDQCAQRPSLLRNRSHRVGRGTCR